MANKHLPHDLAQMQSLPLEAKIRMSDQRIVQWFEYWNAEVYVSFSGGKDSTVLADLCARVCQRYGWTLYLLFVNTGLEYPEIQKFVKTFAEWLRSQYGIEVVLDIVRPKMRFDQVLKNYGYPVISKEVSLKISETRKCPNGYASQSFDSNSPKIQRYGSRFDLSRYKYLLDSPFEISHKCCNVMKKKPAKKFEKDTGRKPLIGTLASESKARQTVWEKHGCNAFEQSRPTSQPLSFWTEQDILHYIKKYNVPYCSVYGDIQTASKDGQLSMSDCLNEYDEADELMTTGCDRTGCIFCMFGCHLEKEPNRFQRLKQTHPKQYKYCIGGGEMVDGKWQPNKEGLGLGKVLDYIGVKYD